MQETKWTAEFIKDLLCRLMCRPMCAETALNKRALKGRTVKKRALGSRFKNGNRLHVCMKFASKSVHSNRTTGFRISWRGQMWDQLSYMKPKSARSYTIEGASNSVHFNRTTGFGTIWRGQLWDQLKWRKPKSDRSYTIIHFQT